MGTIETIFENYKAANNEETPFTKEQQEVFEELNCIMKKFSQKPNPETYKLQQLFFDDAVEFGRESEKAGFILGFKMAMDIMQKCSL